MNRIIISSADVYYIANYWNNENFKDVIEVASNIQYSSAASYIQYTGKFVFYKNRYLFIQNIPLNIVS